MPLDPYFDGDHTEPFQVGPIVPWQDDFTRSRLYKQRLRQLATTWTQAQIGMFGPFGGFLVSESQPRNVGGVIVEWERTFADVPSPIAYPEPFTWPLQILVYTSTAPTPDAPAGTPYSTTYDLAELPIGTTVKAQYTYYNTAQPWIDVPLVRACRWTKVGGSFYIVGSAPYNPGDQFIQAQDTQVTQWRGNIHQAKDLLISVPALTKHT